MHHIIFSVHSDATGARSRPEPADLVHGEDPQGLAWYPAHSKHLACVCWLNKWAKTPADFAYGEPAKMVM